MIIFNLIAMLVFIGIWCAYVITDVPAYLYAIPATGFIINMILAIEELNEKPKEKGIE